MKEFSQITGMPLKFMTHEISHNLVSKLQLNASSRINFYDSLVDKLGDCPGFVVAQKNTQNSDEITVIISSEKCFVVCLGNVEFFVTDNLDTAVQMALAYHVIFSHPFSEICKNLASLFGALLGYEVYGIPSRRTQLLLEKL